MYAGGEFTSIGGQTRNFIAAPDAATGAATSWNPSFNNYVYALAASGTTVYAGGSFASIGNLPQRGIACLMGSAFSKRRSRAWWPRSA